MKKRSFDEWTIDFFEKEAKQIRLIVKIGFFLFSVAYIYFFMRVGFSISGTSEHGLFPTVLYGLIGVIAAVIIFVIWNFWGGIDLDLIKWIGFFIGLAVGGAIIGLIAGFLRGFFGYLTGAVSGLTVIFLTLRYYLPPNTGAS